MSSLIPLLCQALLDLGFDPSINAHLTDFLLVYQPRYQLSTLQYEQIRVLVYLTTGRPDTRG
jgi:hypothetical protein